MLLAIVDVASITSILLTVDNSGAVRVGAAASANESVSVPAPPSTVSVPPVVWKSVYVVMLIISLPAPASILSRPAPPLSVSTPTPPVSVSAPPPPDTLSLEPAPEILSAPAPPVNTSRPSPPIIVTGSVAALAETSIVAISELAGVTES